MAIDFAGTWRNELGSEMELTQTGQSVTGTYRTAVGQPPVTEEFDLVGFASGDLIAFSVNFGHYDSLTSWAGQHTVEGSDEIIHTMWHLARNVEDSDEPAELWAGVLIGANEFTRI